MSKFTCAHHAFAVVLSLLSCSPLIAAGTGQAKQIEGYWVTNNFGSVIELYYCKKILCAEIRWLWANSVAGNRLTDRKNSNEMNRQKNLVGLQLFSHMRNKGTIWKGRIYNPEDGRRYKATISQPGDNILRLKGCWGPFCKSQIWRRLSSVSLPDEADLKSAYNSGAR